MKENTGKEKKTPANPTANALESNGLSIPARKAGADAVPNVVMQQYLRVGNKYYQHNNTKLIAFEDKGNRLETKADSATIVQSLVQIAQARGWDKINASGTDRFRREVWLEAASRGMDAKGYKPTAHDKAALAKRLSETKVNDVGNEQDFRVRENSSEQQTNGNARNRRMAEAFATKPPEQAVKKYPELAGAAAAISAIEKKIEADGLTPEQRTVVMKHVREKAMNSISRGAIPQVKVRKKIQRQKQVDQDQELSL